MAPTKRSAAAISAADDAETAPTNNSSSNQEKKKIVVIVGAGFGGLSTALRLASDGGVKVILLDSNDTFTIGGLWQFVWTNRLTLDQVTFDLREAQFHPAAAAAVELRCNATVVHWDTTQKCVTLKDETVLQYDDIVIACGVSPNAEQIPGMTTNCVNICSFGTVERQKEEARVFLEKAARAKDNNPKITFCLAIGAVPYKCPVAPFELTCLLEEQAVQAGVRDQCRFIITCPTDWPMPPSTKDTFVKVLSERGVEFRGDHVVERIDLSGENHGKDDDDNDNDTTQIVRFQGKEASTADLIWGIHPLQVPAFVREALPESLFVNGSVNIEDSRTHCVQPHVYAIGDCCRVAAPNDSSLLVPKAGEFAWKQGLAVADAILGKAEPFSDRTGRCIAELGKQQGITVENDFSAVLAGSGAHQVKVDITDCSQKLKIDWVNGYLRQIFGESKQFSMEDLIVNSEPNEKGTD